MLLPNRVRNAVWTIWTDENVGWHVTTGVSESIYNLETTQNHPFSLGTSMQHVTL